jgi:c-di-GMP-binding flagellar brake protein YcgR
MLARLRQWLTPGARSRGGIENRVFPRVAPDPGHPIEVQIMGDGFLEVVRARDISVGGISVVVPHQFAGCDLDTQVEVVVKLRGGKAFSVSGKIRHARDNIFGIMFVKLAERDREKIMAYVAARQKEGGTV